jgi:hypothetical protein
MYDSVNGELIESNTGNISSEEDDEDVKWYLIMFINTFQYLYIIYVKGGYNHD